LVFTVSGAYLDGIRLWTVPDQPVEDRTLGTLTDHFFLRRNVKKTLGAGFSGTYYRGAHLGITAEAFLLGLGYRDICTIARPAPPSQPAGAIRSDGRSATTSWASRRSPALRSGERFHRTRPAIATSSA